MSLPVFLMPSLSVLSVGQVAELTGDEARHAVVVRRVRVGEQVLLTDGAGLTATCSVVTVASRSMSARVLAASCAPAAVPRLVVVQALAKGERGELAVEMLTEVGADVIVPWAASRSVAVWRGERAAKSPVRWRSTAREAAKQSRRSWFPVVSELSSTPDVVGLVRDAGLAVVLHEGSAVPIASLEVPAAGDIVLVVGPEGGITDEELESFGDVGAEVVRLGSSVLRTSTAGVAATAVLLARTPRWQ